MATLKFPTLLVITDLPPVRYWIKSHLEDQFFIINAMTEKKALETVKTAHLDFVIIDSAIEDTDPVTLCTKIRALAPQNPFPILLITGRLKKSYRDQALDAGATDFLSDQLDPDELDLRIATGRKATEVRKKVADLSTVIAKSEFKNKALLKDRMIQFLDAAKKENKAVTMLVAQIDEFANLQSNYGLSTTDEILLPVSDLLNQSARGEDIITPASDGQFIILLSNTDPAETKKIAQQFQQKIKKHSFKTTQGPLKITTSFAVSKVDPTKASLNKTINAARSQLSSKKNTIFAVQPEPTK